MNESVTAIPSVTMDIPKANVTLPSGGRIYPLDSPLHAKDLEIYQLTARGEDILTSRHLVKRGIVVDRLVQSAIVNRSIKVEDMILGDKNAVMVAYRITGYGPDYEVGIECPECSQKDPHVHFNLATMPLKELGVAPVEEGKNLFEFILPKTQKKVMFKLLTSRENKELENLIEIEKKTYDVEKNVTLKLFFSTVSIDGKEDRGFIRNSIEVLPAMDSMAYREFINEIEPSIEMMGEFECKNCGFKEVVDCPLDISFFWPQRARSRKR